VKHYVLTRSAYGPDWDIEANRRRLEITRAVTAASMTAQQADWTWVVVVDERDPLLAERIAVFGDCIPILWRPPANPQAAAWDRHGQSARTIQRIAAEAYRAPWRDHLKPGPLLMTRLDDDDGLAPDALARYQQAARKAKDRTVYMLPQGVRVWAGRYELVRHTTNAMHTLYTPAGDDMTVYDYGHRHVERVAPVVHVDRAWGWLWVRHRDTISGYHRATKPLDRSVRRAFPIDWPALEGSWA
jgi:hypothetical protein